MSWKDRLIPGSFRGVPFFMVDHSEAGGRRTVQHEFVDRDTPFSEDLGRKAKSFSVNIRLIGEDVFQQAEAITNALNQRGAGELRHPYLGVLNVNVASYSRSENTDEGRIVLFSITFLEAGTNQYPSIEEDRAQTLLNFSENALSSAAETFEENFSVLQQPGFVVEEAVALVNSAADAFENATSFISETSETLTDLAFSVRNLKADALTLVQQPGELASRLLDSITLLSSVATNADDASSAFSSMYEFSGSDDVIPDVDSDARTQQAQNRNQFNEYVRNMAIIRSTEEAVDRNFFSVQDAQTEQENLKDLIERQAENSANINFFQDMQDLGASLVKNVPNVDNELPNLVSFEVRQTTNTLVLAYQLFEDADKEQEIIDRNDIQNPSFVIGGTVLEVVNDG